MAGTGNGRRYTPEQRVAILTHLAENGGNVLRTARQLAVPETTVRWLRDKGLSGLATIPDPPNHAADWSMAQQRALARINTHIDLLPLVTVDDLLQLMRVADIAARNHLNYTLGRPNATVHIGDDNRRLVFNLGPGGEDVP